MRFPPDIIYERSTELKKENDKRQNNQSADFTTQKEEKKTNRRKFYQQEKIFVLFVSERGARCVHKKQNRKSILRIFKEKKIIKK